eukprot:scaffold93625_cov68-Phaeocystis_antarctica.AAC.1
MSVSRLACMAARRGSAVGDLPARCSSSALSPAAHHHDTQVRSGRQLAAGQILAFSCLVVTEFLLEPMMVGIWLKRHDALVVPPPSLPPEGL